MSIVSVNTYRRLTNDWAETTTAEKIERHVTIAQELLEDWLQRKFDQAVVVDEVVPIIRRATPVWLAMPKYRPVTSVSTAGWAITTEGLLSAAALIQSYDLVYNNYYTQPATAIISYTGGYLDSTAPTKLQMAIAQYAKELMKSDTGAIPAGVTAVKVGGLSVSLSSGGSSAAIPSAVQKLAYGYRSGRS